MGSWIRLTYPATSLLQSSRCINATSFSRSDEVLSVSTSNLSSNSVPALIRQGSESSLPTNLWSQRASVSIDSEATEDDEADRRGSLVNESSPRRGSKLLDFLDKKKKDKKRYKDKQGFVWRRMVQENRLLAHSKSPPPGPMG